MEEKKHEDTLERNGRRKVSRHKETEEKKHEDTREVGRKKV